MNRSKILVAIVGYLVLGGQLASLPGQIPGTTVEQQLHSQYSVTRVGLNGVVVGQPGSVLMMQEDGLIAIPASYGAYWYSTFKKDGHIKPNMVQHVGASLQDAMAAKRAIQVGEKLYLTNMEVTQAEIVFYVQSCGKCDLSVDPNDAPYRARLAFQFNKGYVADSKHVLETIAHVFGVDSSAPPAPVTPPEPVAPGQALKLPATYASVQNPADHLQLNADRSFLLQEGGQPYHGTFVNIGNALELSITETSIKTTVSMLGNDLKDSSGQMWILQGKTSANKPSGDMLQNQDLINLAKGGFDDAKIISMIGRSKCQFDTSADGLIQLKKGGVSDAVLKAVIAAGK